MYEFICVCFEFNRLVIYVVCLEWDIEVSYWGGNVVFEECYIFYYCGVNFLLLFNRVKW